MTTPAFLTGPVNPRIADCSFSKSSHLRRGFLPVSGFKPQQALENPHSHRTRSQPLSYVQLSLLPLPNSIVASIHTHNLVNTIFQRLVEFQHEAVPRKNTQDPRRFFIVMILSLGAFFTYVDRPLHAIQVADGNQSGLLQMTRVTCLRSEMMLAAAATMTTVAPSSANLDLDVVLDSDSFVEAMKAYDQQQFLRAQELLSGFIRDVEKILADFDQNSSSSTTTTMTAGGLRKVQWENDLLQAYKARGNVQVDLKRFESAWEDFERALTIFTSIKEAASATTPESLPEGSLNGEQDLYVQRGICMEGLARWDQAVDEYTRAIQVSMQESGASNPFTLTFRGNALTRLNRYPEAILDYRNAADIFLKVKADAYATNARANLALALYQVGQQDEAVKLMKQIVRRSPGYADMHVALAAHYWNQGDFSKAETEWEFTCNHIDVGCQRYKDMDWVRTIRRWPPTLASQLSVFLEKIN